MKNVSYSFVKQDQDTTGSFVLRSVVNSFGLETVNDKDITSFYLNYSKEQYFDSGLLPVDGSGILSIRKAFNHTQIAYQLKPGMYYINWGRYEGDQTAKKYYVAQPYRIIIADLVDNNLLGARTFYTTQPVIQPQTPLYHVNLPNINCKGYQKTSVGWICLYHTHDISNLPFNEQVVHIIERCSGVEAYNDANMNETDGPRFYRELYQENPSFQHLWDPQEWENYSDSEGYEWTLDPDLWIPVRVQDINNQSKHVPEGHHLKFVDAIIGDYHAYYTDPLVPKPINIISNGAGNISDAAYSSFVRAYNASHQNFDPINIFDLSQQQKEKLSQSGDNLKAMKKLSFEIFTDENGDEQEAFICDDCKQQSTEECFYTPVQQDDSHIDKHLCESCYCEYVYIESIDLYFHSNDVGSSIIYDHSTDEYFHLDHIPPELRVASCSTCYSHFTYPSYDLSELPVNLWNISIIDPDNEVQNTLHVCSNCIKDNSEHLTIEHGSYIEDKKQKSTGAAISSTQCQMCYEYVPYGKVAVINEQNGELSHTIHSDSKVIYLPEVNYSPRHVCNVCYSKLKASPFIKKPDEQEHLKVLCYCGTEVDISDLVSASTYLLPVQEEHLDKVTYKVSNFMVSKQSFVTSTMFNQSPDFLKSHGIDQSAKINFTNFLCSTPNIYTNPKFFYSPQHNHLHDQHSAQAFNELYQNGDNTNIITGVTILFSCKSCHQKMTDELTEMYNQMYSNQPYTHPSYISNFRSQILPNLMNNTYDYFTLNQGDNVKYISSIYSFEVYRIVHN